MSYYDTSYPASIWGVGVGEITGLIPATGVVGTSYTLTVNGSGFLPDTYVSFDGDRRPTTFVSETQLTAQVASLVGPARTVQVTTSNGGSYPFVITAVAGDQQEEPPADDDCPPEETKPSKRAKKSS